MNSMEVLIYKLLMVVGTEVMMTVAVAGAQGTAWGFPKGDFSLLSQEAGVVCL